MNIQEHLFALLIYDQLNKYKKNTHYLSQNNVSRASPHSINYKQLKKASTSCTQPLNSSPLAGVFAASDRTLFVGVSGLFQRLSISWIWVFVLILPALYSHWLKQFQGKCTFSKNYSKALLCDHNYNHDHIYPSGCLRKCNLNYISIPHYILFLRRHWVKLTK